VTIEAGEEIKKKMKERKKMGSTGLGIRGKEWHMNRVLIVWPTDWNITILGTRDS
jgi:hypothetical protein